jgi:ATP-dependent protease Clp ATPase subunit
MLWLTMHSNSAALPRTGRHNQNEQTLERALILGFVMIVATNVLWVVGGNFQQLSQHILSQLHSSLVQLQ